MTATVFLDRDGTINREVSFVRSPAGFELLPGVRPALERLRDHGFRLVVVTNQSGIARGMYTQTELARVHEHMTRLLPGLFSAILHCPHHPDMAGPYGGPCQCRKPAAGMLDSARELLGCDFDGDYLVGDSARDLLMAKELPVRTVYVRSGKPPVQELDKLREHGVTPDADVADLPAAVDWILAQSLGRRC